MAAATIFRVSRALTAAGLVVAIGSTADLFGQVNLGADVVSRYVWRGGDFGESVSLQPTLSYTRGALEVGTWASYSISASGSGANEHDIYVSYALDRFAVGLTDYYFPNAGVDFFDFSDGGEGAHFVEPFVVYEGPEDLPVTVFFGIFAYNDPANSTYLELGYPLYSDGVDLGITLAGTFSGSEDEPSLYGTTGPGIVSASLSATKELKLSDSFALPVNVTYTINPYDERTFLVFGFSVAP